MRLRLNRLTAGLLLIFLAPIVLPIKLYRWLRGERKPTYQNTLEGDPLEYVGDRPVIVAIWATWASVWKAGTAPALEQLKSEFAGRCEFAYVEDNGRTVREQFAIEVVPTVLVFHYQREVARFVNMLDAEEIRPTLQALIEPDGTTPPPA